MHAPEIALRTEQRSWHMAAGLRLASAIPLDEQTRPSSPGIPDVTVELSERPFTDAGVHVLSVGEPGSPWLEVRRLSDGYAALWGDKLQVLIPDGGRRMLVYTHGEIEDSIPRLLMCHAMSFVLPWHGRESVHASAVELDGRAVVLAGGSGRGKSTLATALCARGGRLLSDDLTSLRVTAEGVVVDPTATQTWLWREVAHEMAPANAVESTRLHKVTVGQNAAQGPVPVAAMMILGFKADSAVLGEQIEGTAALRTFLGQLFNYAIRTPERLAQQFQIATELCGSVPMVPVLWEPGPARAGAMADQIEQFVRAASEEHASGTHASGAQALKTQGETMDRETSAPPSFAGTDRRRLLELLSSAGVEATIDEQFDEPLLRTSQVAALLRTSDRTIRTWAEAGKLTYIKTLGGRRLFPASGVMAVMKTMRAAGVAREEA